MSPSSHFLDSAHLSPLTAHCSLSLPGIAEGDDGALPHIIFIHGCFWHGHEDPALPPSFTRKEAFHPPTHLLSLPLDEEEQRIEASARQRDTK